MPVESGGAVRLSVLLHLTSELESGLCNIMPKAYLEICSEDCVLLGISVEDA